jgi:hypothetical protein
LPEARQTRLLLRNAGERPIQACLSAIGRISMDNAAFGCFIERGNHGAEIFGRSGSAQLLS